MCNVDKFKSRIKELCNQYGISQKYLCDKIGRAKTYLNDVWNGKTNIKDNDLQTIASILHTTPEYLKGETDIPDAPDKITIDESQIKVALFGGGKEVTDEMWDEVKRFVEFVAQKHSKG